MRTIAAILMVLFLASCSGIGCVGGGGTGSASGGCVGAARF